MSKLGTCCLVASVAMFGLFLSGCSSAGPFVTNIYGDGAGGLVVEKCEVKYNGFTGTIYNDPRTRSTMNVRVCGAGRSVSTTEK
jgi:hypothetical protein